MFCVNIAFGYLPVRRDRNLYVHNLGAQMNFAALHVH